VNSDTKPIKVGFSFYPADMTALKDRTAELKKAGVKVRAGTFLRALIYLTTPVEMHAHALLLASAYAKKDGPREADNVTGHPTVDLPKDQVRKLDDVVDGLHDAGVTATRAFVVRAVLRSLRDGGSIAPDVRQFLENFPPKPRGWQVAGTWKAKKHG
jgi:hypothetical protein